MHVIPGTERTINPWRCTNLPPDASNETITDWCWLDTVLHPYDQRVLCEVGTPMDAHTFYVLQAAGCDSVRIAKIDWEAEDKDLGEWLSQPIPKPTPTTGYTGTSPAEFVEYHVGKPYQAEIEIEVGATPVRIALPEATDDPLDYDF